MFVTLMSNHWMTFILVGLEPLLPVPSVHGHPLVCANVLEVCCHHCDNLSDICNGERMGNAKGK